MPTKTITVKVPKFAEAAKSFQKAQAILEDTVKEELRPLGEKIKKDIQTYITSGKVTPGNADLTRLLKGTKPPLLDTGALVRSVEVRQASWDTLEVGFFPGNRHYERIRAVLLGSTVPVTSKMRALFFMLWQVSSGKKQPTELSGPAAEMWKRYPGRDWKPLSRTTRAIILPERNFIPAINVSKTVVLQTQFRVSRALKKQYKKLADEMRRHNAKD